MRINITVNQQNLARRKANATGDWLTQINTFNRPNPLIWYALSYPKCKHQIPWTKSSGLVRTSKQLFTFNCLGGQRSIHIADISCKKVKMREKIGPCKPNMHLRGPLGIIIASSRPPSGKSQYRWSMWTCGHIYVNYQGVHTLLDFTTQGPNCTHNGTENDIWYKDDKLHFHLTCQLMSELLEDFVKKKPRIERSGHWCSTGLHTQKAYTHSGTSSSQCGHQICSCIYSFCQI